MASRLNPDRTDAPDPISIDDRLLALMREQGMTPGMAKMPGAPMIVANPLYPDAAPQQAQQASPNPTTDERTSVRRPVAKSPSRQPASADDEGGFVGGAKYAGYAPDDTGGFTGGAKYAFSPQSGNSPQTTQTATAPTQTAPQIKSVIPEGGLETAVGAAGAGLLGYEGLRRLYAAWRGRQGNAPDSSPTVDDFINQADAVASRQVPANKQLTGPAETEAPRATGETIAAGDRSASAEPELIKPTDFNQPVPEARRPGEAPQTRLGQPTWDQPKGGVPDGGAEIPATRQSDVVTLDKSGLHVHKSDIDALIANSLRDGTTGIRGGGARARAPRATIK